MTGVLRGIATPIFTDEAGVLVELGVEAERQGFDGFFVWDHVLYANDGDGPDVLDPWTILAAIAAKTTRIKLGPMITPLSRRRPWIVARQCATLDRLSHGRFVLGVGLGAPAEGDFGRFGDVTDDRVRGEMLDESLTILDGLWSGEMFGFAGEHYQIEPVRFRPTPVQHPRIPIWVGGVIPARKPLARAAKWDGYVPISYVDRVLTRPSVNEIALTRDALLAARGTLEGYELIIWSEVIDDAGQLAATVSEYERAGATWFIETGRVTPGWLPNLQQRVALGRDGRA
jgi:alkanesulfonate monooxygenase SsuD/methylene tetrahydromethanopterin reductase-like flavin-dependent oxidoreductase (luciferase family)